VATALVLRDAGPVRAVVFRLSRRLRCEWRATLFAAVLVTIVSGTTLAIAAGAQRTAGVSGRYASAYSSSYNGQIIQDGGPPRLAEVAAVPGVEAIEAATFLFAGLQRPDGSDIDSIVFAGSLGAIGHLVAGRVADPGAADEMVVSSSFLTASHAAIGDQFEFFAFTTAQSEQYGFNAPDPPAYLGRVTIVGAFEAPSDFDDPRQVALVSNAAVAGRDVGVSATLMSVRTAPGVDLAELRTRLDALTSGGPLVLDPAVTTIAKPTLTAVDAQARGLWILAFVSGAAAVVALGQLITRQSRVDGAERWRLVALGMRGWQLDIEAVCRAALPVFAGVAAGVALAPLASGLFPTGVAGRVEPQPGLRIEVGTLLAGGALLTLALLSWSATALMVRLSAGNGRAPAGAVDALARRCGSATAGTGLRLAFTRRARDSGSVRGSVTGLMAVIAGLAGSLTFSASLDRLVREPARYGQNFDALLGSAGSGQATLSDGERQLLADEDAIGAATLYGSTQVRIGSTTLLVVGFESVRGQLVPTLVSGGRLPVADDEIALGRLTARSLGVHVGDVIPVETTGAPRELRVTGLAIVPSLGLNNGIGHDGVVTAGTLARLDPDAVLNSAVIARRPGAPPGTMEHAAEGYGVRLGPPNRVAEITNVARVRSVPLLLAAVLAGLTVLTLVHLLLTSIRNRRHDIGVLKALGADRSWLARALHWQATSFALLPALVGLPVGLVAGRLVFRAFAGNMGVVDGADAPLVFLALVLLGLLVISNGVAPLARRRRHLLPAPILRSE
jgi:hypothetical protein